MASGISAATLSFAPVHAGAASAAVPGQPAGLPLELRDVGKAFNGRAVLSGLTLHLPAGQFVAVVGKSGCGKSTLLRLIAGLETPTTGALNIGPEDRTGIRLMFQEARLLPWARVLDNVLVGLGQRTPAARERAAAALRDVGLGDRADSWPATLSGGQKQRVALARALVSGPRLLALDEPLGALDALTRIEMQRLLERIWRSLGFTAVLVTHDVGEAVALADRVIVIDQGRIALDLDIPLPRPRQRGAAEAAALEGLILDRLFHEDGGRPA